MLQSRSHALCRRTNSRRGSPVVQHKGKMPLKIGVRMLLDQDGIFDLLSESLKMQRWNEAAEGAAPHCQLYSLLQDRRSLTAINHV